MGSDRVYVCATEAGDEPLKLKAKWRSGGSSGMTWFVRCAFRLPPARVVIDPFLRGSSL